jgi:hypothetical protein
MKTTSKLQRALRAFLIAGISIFSLALAHAADAPKVSAFNSAKKDKDGSVTIHFGGDPKADNFLPIVPGWNYIVRMYKPGPEILNGSWKFPDAIATE